jgi:F-type H+-transporting ATPase subunit a
VVVRGSRPLIPGILAATFEAPSTRDFVYGCWGGGVEVFGFELCLNFVTFLVILTFVIMFVLFYLAFRKPTVVPGKLQTAMELGVAFVREQIAIPVLGQDGDRFLPLLASMFFFILIGNLFEVIPGFSFSANSRVAFPLTLSIIAWFTYNIVGIRKHGFFGYLRHTCIIAEAPALLRYSLLMVIEFVSNIIIRPITLTVRRRGCSPRSRSCSRSDSSASRSSSPSCRRSSSRSSPARTSAARSPRITRKGRQRCSISWHRPRTSPRA